MTAIQIFLLFFVILAVAAIAYVAGRRASSASGKTAQAAPPLRDPTGQHRASEDGGGAGPSIEQQHGRASRVPDIATARKPVSVPPLAPRPTPPPSAMSNLPGSGRSPSGRPTVVSWGYQLQQLNVARAAESPFDVLVVDYAKDGGDDSALTTAEVARLQRKPDGSRRLVFAYLSIGEAESYRGYWQPSWKKSKPAWLLKENPEWDENYAVCFWDPGWQALMCGNPQARLDRILAAGFDGVYLDKCDVFEDMRSRRMPEANSRPNLEADMVAFVTRLSGYAKSRNAQFMVIMQNTESLLDRPELRRVLDGIAKEELIYGVEAPERKNGREDFEFSRQQIDLMKREGKLVLVVEYLNNPTKIEDAVRTAGKLGYPLYIADKNRELDKLHTPPPIA